MIRTTLLMLILVNVFTISACQPEPKIKPGFIGYRIDDDIVMDKIKKSLKENDIEYYTYKEDGKEIIAYSELTEKKAESVISLVTTGLPSGHTGFCYKTKQQAAKQMALLARNNIPSAEYKRPPYLPNQQDAALKLVKILNFCVAWQKKYDDVVAKIDPHYRRTLDLQEKARSK